MTPRLLARQLRDRQLALGIVPGDVLAKMSDANVIRGYVIGNNAQDDESLADIIAKSENVSDFFDAITSDRNAAKRLWPHSSDASTDDFDQAPNAETDESNYHPCRFLPFSDVRDFGSPILFAFTVESVQDFAADNCDGPLTQAELGELFVAFCESFSLDLMHEAISRIRPHLRSAPPAKD